MFLWRSRGPSHFTGRLLRGASLIGSAPVCLQPSITVYGAPRWDGTLLISTLRSFIAAGIISTHSSDDQLSWNYVWLRYLKTAGETAEPLLRVPPSRIAAAFPSIDTCPTIEALDAHIQKHSYEYSLRHVATGLTTLSSLRAHTTHGAHEASSSAVPTVSSPDSAAVSPFSGKQPSAEVTNLFGDLHRTGNGIVRRSLAPSDCGGTQPSPDPRVEACARRLALLGHHQMKREVNLEAMALCITGIAGLSMPAPAKAQLALPFVKRLRDPSYFFAMRDQTPKALTSLLYALSELPLYRHVQKADIAPMAQVLARLVMSLTSHVVSFSAQDACRATEALVRLGAFPERREALAYQTFLQALASHIVTSLVESSLVSPAQAVRLLRAYAALLPASCSPAAGSSARDNDPKYALPADSSQKTWGGSTVPQLVAVLSRVSCRSLDSHLPLELVKLVSALQRLGAQQEAQAVLPGVTPRLLRQLSRLDIAALAEVASAYHLAHVHEPGLLQAIADQVMESVKDCPVISTRVVTQLKMCYGARGSHYHPELQLKLLNMQQEYVSGDGTAGVERNDAAPGHNGAL